jgi:hypothetical protein
MAHAMQFGAQILLLLVLVVHRGQCEPERGDQKEFDEKTQLKLKTLTNTMLAGDPKVFYNYSIMCLTDSRSRFHSKFDNYFLIYNQI